MKERFFIIISLLLIFAALIGLNAASYAPVEREPDKEARPNRSTFNTGATGTRAFFDFLRETNRSVTRWQQKPEALLNPNAPKTFVVIGELRQEFEKNELKDLLAWVRRGGNLVLIDRKPPGELLPLAGTWLVSAEESAFVSLDVQPDNVNQMVGDAVAATPVQPTPLTNRVNRVRQSKFATKIKIQRFNEQTTANKTASPTPNASPSPNQSPRRSDSKNTAQQRDDEDFADDETTNQELSTGAVQILSENDSQAPLAPTVHLATGDAPLLIDYNYGAGKIVFLSDPYIISNAGIESVDNLRLATNLVAGGGLIAFDEYHQGYGARGNSLYNFFADTPLPAIAAQLALLALLVVYTRGRRFARPLPLPTPDRRSKLEYVAAMAELQRRTKAYDLALENIYARVRRDLARRAGVDNLTTKPEVLAERLAEQSRLDKNELARVLQACEDIVHGAPTNAKEVLQLVARLREIERELGFNKFVGNK